MNFFNVSDETTPVHSVWNERYRPTTLEHYVGNDTLKQFIQGCIDANDVPHFLFHGRAGVGKTTLAKLLVRNIECDYIYINASDENSVDTVRTTIRNFASSASFKPLKLIILDECLDEDTLVHVLRNGEPQEVAIKDVDSDWDLVKSWNIRNSRVEWKTFAKMDKGIQDVYEIELDNGEVVVCTSDHKWYVMGDDNTPIVVSTSELDMYEHILSPQ